MDLLRQDQQAQRVESMVTICSSWASWVVACCVRSFSRSTWHVGRLGQSHHGRRLLTLGDAEDLVIAAVLELDAVPDVALLLAALGLLAVDDEPSG